jgi:hypothetical protein
MISFDYFDYEIPWQAKGFRRTVKDVHSLIDLQQLVLHGMHPTMTELNTEIDSRAENLRPAVGRGIDSRNRVWN